MGHARMSRKVFRSESWGCQSPVPVRSAAVEQADRVDSVVGDLKNMPTVRARFRASRCWSILIDNVGYYVPKFKVGNAGLG